LKTSWKRVKQFCTKNEGEIKKVEAIVEKLAEEVQKKAKKVERAAENGESSVYEELRERETRRLNVVMYGMGKAAEGQRGEEGGTGTSGAA
jgi:hypothetical protein